MQGCGLHAPDTGYLGAPALFLMGCWSWGKEGSSAREDRPYVGKKNGNNWKGSQRESKKNYRQKPHRRTGIPGLWVSAQGKPSADRENTAQPGPTGSKGEPEL